ncbi:uncharacterized protein LOC128716757 [Anopheles marshallii]|uniref:uncharacterized protein LOC128716756 n=1 Tax=Anopheles marshallii TaxID=1521116 RepID=UPI00237A97DF|nr:uncharacterized protein LOC128716756 [Anopheles marshallii]XP_053667341.1 uncharacterized protein LOC128716757 [Anopheles marshallii]
MSTNRLLRPRLGSTETRPPVGAKPMVVLTKLAEEQTTATSGAARTSSVGTIPAAATVVPMERLIERLEDQLALLRVQLMEQAEQFRKDLAALQEGHRQEVLYLREENRKEREMVSGLLAQLQQLQQQQQQERAGAVTATVVPSPDQEGGSWAEVVRRKPARQQPTQQQQQQPKKTRKRPDVIKVTPAEGVSYLDLYKLVRTSEQLAEEQKQIGVGKRTPKDTLKLPLSRDVDSAKLCQRIRAVIGDKGAAIVRTEMAQVLVTNIDSLANEDQLRQAMLTALGKQHMEAAIDMWERRDGTNRARVTLPRSDAEHLAGKRLLLGHTSCWVWEVPKASLAEKRCFRCLERGHFAGQCSGEDRSKTCIRCGAEGHKAATCIGQVRCIKCGGPHPIASAQCKDLAQR